MAEETPGRWVRTYATDVAPGDKIRLDGVEHRVVHRDYPSVTRFTLDLTVPGGHTLRVPKLSDVEIWDPDGSVARRVQMISQEPSR